MRQTIESEQRQRATGSWRGRLLDRMQAELVALTVAAPPAWPLSPRSRRRPTTALTLGASLSGLGILTRVALQPTPGALDVALTRLLQRRQPPLMTRLFVLISAPGFAPLQHTLTLGTALDLWAVGLRREAFFTMGTMGAGVITGILKAAVGRPRPDPSYMQRILQFRDKSFPSGHCTHYSAFYGYMFYLARRGMRPSPLRTAIMATCAGLIVFVAPSRVYLGHHWSSDVVAGDLVGLTYLFLLIQAYEHLAVSPPSTQDGR